MAATHCNTLHHTATHCKTLQHNAIPCNTLQHTCTLATWQATSSIHSNTLQHTETQCIKHAHTGNMAGRLQHTAVRRNSWKSVYPKLPSSREERNRSRSDFKRNTILAAPVRCASCQQRRIHMKGDPCFRIKIFTQIDFRRQTVLTVPARCAF